uniref:Uncharacterized protein n=1 Tax=Ditylenchus dipsaci TaxID=166011 RepID=A0A915DYX5_9BILA
MKQNFKKLLRYELKLENTDSFAQNEKKLLKNRFPFANLINYSPQHDYSEEHQCSYQRFPRKYQDWYAEMSQQFISANYRNFLEDQKKQQNFELQLERLELNFDEESKRTQLDVSQRLKQYLLQKESKDMAPRIQPQSVSSIPAVANVGKSINKRFIIQHLHKRIRFCLILLLTLPKVIGREETNYDPQLSITELEDDTLEVVCGNKSAAISENQLIAVPSPTSSASLFQVKPTTSEATKIEQPTTKEISASREAIGVAPPTTWGITGKTDLPKSADLELRARLSPSHYFPILHLWFQKVDEVKPAFSFRTANSGNVESSTVGRTLQEEGQIVIPAFTGVAFDFKKDGKSDAESQKLPKSSESPVSFQFNKAAPPKPSLTQEPIAFQFNKAASPPPINKTTEKAEFAFQPNKDSSIAQASLFGTQPSGSSLFSSARAAVSPAAVVPSASVFPFASHAKSTSSSTAITPLSSLFSFAPKICSPDIANKLSITDLKGDEEIMDPNFLGGCKLAKWIQFYTTFHRQITAEITSFEKDADLKKLRISLKKSIVDKINFVAKKKATNQDLGKVFFYFFELFDFKTVKTQDNEDLKLDKENSGMINFVMSTICYRFIDKVKWDVDLTSQ